MGSLIRIFKNVCKRISSLELLPRVYNTYRQICKITQKYPEAVILGMTEHIGDIVVCEPIARFLTENENRKVIWIIDKKYTDLLKYNPNVYTTIEISSLSEWIFLKKMLTWWTLTPVYDLHLHEKSCSKYHLHVCNHTRADITPENYYNNRNLLAVFCLVGGLPVLNMSPRIYLPPLNERKNLNLPEKYIAIQTTSNEERRCWDLKKWNILINHFHDFTFIELGLKPTIQSANCISDYCGKTSLLDVAQIIEKSQLFIGIDSSFAHFANAFAKNSVILLGQFATFDYYMPYSGNFEDKKIATVFHHSDIVYSLPANEVIQAVSERLSNKKNLI